MSFAARLERAWYEGAFWLCLLWPLEGLFRAVVALRRGLYRRGTLRSYRAPVPVVVVGNITVGGTGKTPVVIALVEALQQAGLRPGVVSRGYGGRAPLYPHRLSEISLASDAGDEPLLIYQRTGAAVVVDPLRARAVQALEQEVDIVLCDDGLQHYALARDYEIAVLDAARGMGNGHCLPAGPLREPAVRLDEVNFRLRRGSDSPEEGVRYTLGRVRRLDGCDELSLEAFASAGPCRAVAGIGQPQQFFDTLKAAGLQFSEHSFADHHTYTEADFLGMSGGRIIMTEKDAVKCRAVLPAERLAEAWYLPIDATLPQALLDEVVALARRAD
ncbi:tetraacyldisaccharide 4'-kinase [Parahaliea maris]|uniref:Tetraacyldisaccharide 4'-kinase n=1 Tax=Parahaliea maris TaxID=2716870 RepID=A0A5C8ZYW3_9GAMM|nr:tetraacyldisaccharide 4'-kinase [Parahaliea maris]TXS92999.1 tetraacyldisaccharide 4'-kinase [Parahaliea maris]